MNKDDLEIIDIDNIEEEKVLMPNEQNIEPETKDIETVSIEEAIETLDIDNVDKPQIVQEQIVTEKEKQKKESKSGITLVIIILLILIIVVLFLPQISEMLS